MKSGAALRGRWPQPRGRRTTGSGRVGSRLRGSSPAGPGPQGLRAPPGLIQTGGEPCRA